MPERAPGSGGGPQGGLPSRYCGPRTDAKATGCAVLDGVIRQRGDVDEEVGGLDAELHQVDQIGAAGQIPGAGCPSDNGQGVIRLGRPLVTELPHRPMSTMAATMLT